MRPFAVTVGIDGMNVTFEADSIENLIALRKAWEPNRDDKKHPAGRFVTAPDGGFQGVSIPPIDFSPDPTPTVVVGGR